jgi:hypothetical protein
MPATADPTATTVPPGSDADLALWRRAYDLNNEIPIERSISTRLQLQERNSRIVEALADAAAGSGGRGLAPAEAARLEAELRGALKDVVETLVARWPVDPTRVCGYDLLFFDSVLRSDEGPQKAGQLAQTGAALRDCVARGEQPLAVLRKANERLRQAIADSERALASAKAPAAASR